MLLISLIIPSAVPTPGTASFPILLIFMISIEDLWLSF